MYKTKASEFPDTKASVLGEFIPARLGMDEDESVLSMAVTKDYGGYMLFAFENGKAAKVELSAYATKTNRRKLLGAYSDKSPAAAILQLPEDCEVLFQSANRKLLVHTGAIPSKTTRNTQGVAVILPKKNQKLESVSLYTEGSLDNPNRYRKNIPSPGAI